MAMVSLCRPIAILFVLAASAALRGQQATSAGADKKLLEKAAVLNGLLDQWIQTESLQKEQPLDAFLKALEDKLPNDKKIKLGIDKKAFGSEFEDVTKTLVKMPAYPKSLTVHTVLKLVVSQIADPDPYLDVLPTSVSITTRAHAALYTVEHEIGDLVKQARRHHAAVRNSWKSFGPDFDVHDVDPRDGVALLIRLIAADSDYGNPLASSRVQDQPKLMLSGPQEMVGAVGSGSMFASIRVHNQSKLELRGTAQEHFRVAALFAALRRLADVAVVMHACLVEVNRAWHDQHLAPVLATEGRGPEALSAVPIDPALARKLKQQRIVVQGDAGKLPAEQKTVFLSWQRPFSFVAEPARLGTRETRRTGVEGVVFQVDAAVSADRRSLRLKISQDVGQLVVIEKKRLRVIRDDKGADYESPTVRHGGVAAEIELEDGVAFVMPVAYRPAGGKSGERRWLLLAEPMIWIEEEQRLIEMGERAPMR
jgi:hypothetical protein